MTQSSDPQVQWLALKLHLRKIRLEAKLGQAQVAQSLDWSPSKILRIESGEAPVSAHDLNLLLDYYAVSDAILRNDLMRMAEVSRTLLNSAFNDVLSREMQRLIRYERSASIIRQFEPNLIPGLLQTRDYAQVMLKLYARTNDSDEIIQRRVEARMERQALLAREDLPEMYFIVDEAVVRRWVGGETDRSTGPAIMRQQLLRLKQVAENPRVHIQIVPFRAGAHLGMKGPFVILEFADPALGELLYLEDPKGDYISREDPEDTRPYLEAFWKMEGASTNAGDLHSFIDEVLAGMQ
jgi:transcriptional regulator with XRE-family HTH domain